MLLRHTLADRPWDRSLWRCVPSSQKHENISDNHITLDSTALPWTHNLQNPSSEYSQRGLISSRGGLLIFLHLLWEAYWTNQRGEKRSGSLFPGLAMRLMYLIVNPQLTAHFPDNPSFDSRKSRKRAGRWGKDGSEFHCAFRTNACGCVLIISSENRQNPNCLLNTYVTGCNSAQMGCWEIGLVHDTEEKIKAR